MTEAENLAPSRQATGRYATLRFGDLARDFRAMTAANKITIARICLIPAFIWLAWAYGQSVVRGQPVDWYRFGAIAIFVTAASTDGLDGFVARRFNQQSRLGSILDPIADKGLVSATLIVLAVAGWPHGLPLWFPCIVIGRDIVLVLGFTILNRLIPNATVRPSIAGKLSTLFQLATILWTLLGIRIFRSSLLLAAIAFTVISGAGYVLEGFRQLRERRLIRGEK